jgi:hypothetical protein
MSGMACEEKRTGTSWEEWVEKLRLLLIPLALSVLFVAFVYAIGDATLAPMPSPGKPSSINTLLGSRAVVAAIRLAIISAAAFVVISVLALIKRRQWLIRVGPVEVSEQVSNFDADSQRLEHSLEEAEQTIDSLRYELAQSNSLLAGKSESPGGMA